MFLLQEKLVTLNKLDITFTLHSEYCRIFKLLLRKKKHVQPTFMAIKQ